MITRRHFTAGTFLAAGSLAAGSLAAPAVLSSPARAQARADLDLAIVGAGAAGLVAAHRAREKKLTAKIFEAQGRIGGRVHTDESLGAGFEAGAFYIHFAERNPWREIAEQQKFELVDDNTLWGGFNVFRHGKPLPAEERSRRRGAFGRLSMELEREGRDADLSFAEAARRHAPELLEAARGLTLLSLGEDPDHVSIRDYQALDSGDDFVLPGGYGHLLETHGKRLDIALNSPVSAIDLSGPGVRLTVPGGVVTARAVLLTASIGVLQAGGIRITPDWPTETQQALSGLRMGAMTKVALRMDGDRLGLSPWTQYFDQGDGNELINFEFWPFGRPLIVATFGGDYARSLAKAGETNAVSTIRDRLVAILGESERTRLPQGRLAGWSADPYALGSYSIALPGRMEARRVLERPVRDRLWLAGEANAGPASMTAGGAALSAQRAVDEIARRLATGAIRRD
ncbi:MAG: FAD-dependent oxidoreductase [Beijerinckiaceae bacterium]|nr:FAD-dependent oxidoreductase [Beijerinckiaceae bacterium]